MLTPLEHPLNIDILILGLEYGHELLEPIQITRLNLILIDLQ